VTLELAEQRRDLLVVAAAQARPGGSVIADQLSRFLNSKGLSANDIATAIDIFGLGPGKSAIPGGGLAGNFGGALHDERRAARDQPPCDEELLGQVPWKGDSRRRGGRDSRMSFDGVFDLLPTHRGGAAEAQENREPDYDGRQADRELQRDVSRSGADRDV
jgi:hypothetical protein